MSLIKQWLDLLGGNVVGVAYIDDEISFTWCHYTIDLRKTNKEFHFIEVAHDVERFDSGNKFAFKPNEIQLFQVVSET